MKKILSLIVSLSMIVSFDVLAVGTQCTFTNNSLIPLTVGTYTISGTTNLANATNVAAGVVVNFNVAGVPTGLYAKPSTNYTVYGPAGVFGIDYLSMLSQPSVTYVGNFVGNGAGLTNLPVATIWQFGALGGTNVDTAAFQAAANSGGPVNFGAAWG